MYSCTHWLRPRNSPLPPHLGSCMRALLVSQDRRHLFVTPRSIRTWPVVAWREPETRGGGGGRRGGGDDNPVNSPDVEENRWEKPVLGAAASIGGVGSGGSSDGGGGSSGGSGQISNPAWASPVPSWYQSSEVEGGMLPVPEDSIFVEIMTFFWSIQFEVVVKCTSLGETTRYKPRFKNHEVLDYAFLKSPSDRFPRPRGSWSCGQPRGFASWDQNLRKHHLVYTRVYPQGKTMRCCYRFGVKMRLNPCTSFEWSNWFSSDSSRSTM